MGDYTHENLTLVGRHEPDTTTERDAHNIPYTVELPGLYTIGAIVEGVFVPLRTFKAGKMLRRIEQAQQTAAASPPTPPEPAPAPEAPAEAPAASPPPDQV